MLKVFFRVLRDELRLALPLRQRLGACQRRRKGPQQRAAHQGALHCVYSLLGAVLPPLAKSNGVRTMKVCLKQQAHKKGIGVCALHAWNVKDTFVSGGAIPHPHEFMHPTHSWLQR